MRRFGLALFFFFFLAPEGILRAVGGSDGPLMKDP